MNHELMYASIKADQRMRAARGDREMHAREATRRLAARERARHRAMWRRWSTSLPRDPGPNGATGRPAVKNGPILREVA